MLNYLEIQNIALIEKTAIEFGSGLCVLTGETGAGKSIVIDSINAVLGTKLPKEIIRTGAESATVTAVFSLGSTSENAQLFEVFAVSGVELEDDKTVIISREISKAGRSRCRINGKLVPSSVIKMVGELIIDLHGQHDNHSLLKKEKHIDLIDNYGGEESACLKGEYGELYMAFHKAKREIAALAASESERIRTIDILMFQIQEIKEARLTAQLDVDLETEISLLANAEKISKSLNSAYIMLCGNDDSNPSAMESINNSLHVLHQIGGFNTGFMTLYDKLQNVAYQLDDINAAIRTESHAVLSNPKRLDQLQERLETVNKLKKKYGATIKDVYLFYKNAKKQLEMLSRAEQSLLELEQECDILKQKMVEKAQLLTVQRQKIAAQIEQRIVHELAELEMRQTQFQVVIHSADNVEGYNAKGRDQVEFLLSANPGEELKPLAKIASGGEMSRIMLAIKSVLADSDNIPTMIFDEIDAGISGKAASRVAEKMHVLTKGRQIICVTHLAQIACMADDQFLIEKTSTEDKTMTKVSKLPLEGRVTEISRLLGGDTPTETSAILARELIDNAEKFKQKSRNP